MQGMDLYTLNVCIFKVFGLVLRLDRYFELNSVFYAVA